MAILRNRALAAAIVLSALVAAPAAALDIEASGFFGNLGLPWIDDGVALAYEQYPANLWLYGGRLAVKEELAEGFSLLAEYRTDPVLRHVVRGIVSYDTGIASISAGPMLGAFNSAGTPLKAGIDIGFRLEAPGIAFFTARTDSSMGAGLSAVGDYSQEMSELTGGWYVYNAICTVSMLSRRYTRVLPSGSPLVDAATDYMFSVDIHKKSAPYRILTEFGYQTKSRTYPDAVVDGMASVVLGATISAELSPSLTVIAGLDSAVYAFGYGALAAHSPAATSFMFSAKLGIVIHLDTKAAAEEAAE